MAGETRPVVLITGAAGHIGTALRRTLDRDYQVVGMDRPGAGGDIDADLGSDEAVRKAFHTFRQRHGGRIAAVVHLAAYFDFTGEESPLYENVNVQGTRRLLQALQDFDLERFVYTSTMLVHRPAGIGERVNEEYALEPKWAYPESKARAEQVIRERHGHIPYVILRLAGLYDEHTAIPTLTHQIARIYERVAKSHFYAGDMRAGQSLIHEEDLMDLLKRTVDRRNALPPETAILAGEEDVVSYDELQDRIGRLIHGKDDWTTIRLPGSLAKAGAWLEEKSEPLVPDAIDRGEKPFIRPFMIDMASDHYALDTGKAAQLLGWRARHRIREILPEMIHNLKDDPPGWYRDNGISPPDWLSAAAEKSADPESFRVQYEQYYRTTHAANLWAHFLNAGMGFWLMTSPFILGYESTGMIVSDILSGFAVLIFGLLSLSWQMSAARWGAAAVGFWLLLAPLVFWAPTAAAYLNGTLVGSMVIGFALLSRPPPGVSPVAAMTGPEIPPGWEFSPSSWMQRLPIILLAAVGLVISRYLAAYQLGHIDAVWDPFFAGTLPDAENGTEEIITSSVSEAWPVPDAGMGAMTYALEILTGIMGSSRRWRTMPWLVLLFGFMIVPLGAVSITFIIIQPILLGTWCTLCLVAALAMLLQIPYSFDEIIATCEFLLRRKRAGRPLLRILFTGDTDEGRAGEAENEFERPPRAIFRDMIIGGISTPWTLLGCIAIGIWLMFTRVSLGAEGAMANADHLIGSLVVTFTITAFAEVTRQVRYLNILLGAALAVTSLLYGESWLATGLGIACAVGLILLSLPRGDVRNRYGEWSRFIV